MPEPLGLSFSPFNTAQPQNVQGAGQPGAAPSAQDAIRVLSLRLPRVVGAGALAPGPLLNAPGGAAFGGSGFNLEQLLQLLFGQRPGQMGIEPGTMRQPMTSPMGSLFGGAMMPQPGLPMPGPDRGKAPAPYVQPGQGELPIANPLPGGTAGPGPAERFGPGGTQFDQPRFGRFGI